MKIKIKKLQKNAIIPTKGSKFSAGYDLYACLENSIKIKPGETVKISTGIAISIPNGYAGFIFARSGISTKKGLAPANKVGVIDSDYRGEIIVALHNHSNEIAEINSNDRIAQLVLIPVLDATFVETNSLDDTERNIGGFGSTGI